MEINNMPGFIFWKDVNFNYTACNQNLADVFCVDNATDLIGKNSQSFGMGKDSKLDDEQVLKGESRKSEYHFKNRKGEEKWVSVEKKPTYDSDGKINGIIGVAVDITETKKMMQKIKHLSEKLAANNALKKQLLGLIACEIRKPIGNSLGLIEMLEENTELSRAQKELVIKMHTSINSITHILNCISEIIDLDEEEISIEINKKCSMSSIADLIEEVVKKIDYSHDNEHCIYINTDTAFNSLVEINSHATSRVLDILMYNARRFTKKNGKIILDVSIDEKNSTLNISIKDEGPGIPTNQIEKILDPTMDYINDGMRLVLVKKLIQKMKGRMLIDSKIDEYTDVKLQIPFTKIMKMGTASIKKNDSRNILVIDHDELSFDIVKKALEKAFNIYEYDNTFKDLKDAQANISAVLINQEFPHINNVINKIQDNVQIILYSNRHVDIHLSKTTLDTMHFLKPYIYPSKICNIVEKVIQNHVQSKKTALIVEDDSIFQTIESKALTSLGFKVDIAPDGHTAIENIRNNVYDFIFLDIDLPDINGFELAPLLFEAAINKPVIIAITARDSAVSQIDFTEIGIKRVIIKPIHINYLKTIINDIADEVIQQK